MAPSSRFALSLKPNVAYLVLNFCALWKKQTTLPSLAYAGIPYQVLGQRAGALALMMAWSRSAMARSRFGISAIFASTSLSPSALPAAAFSSWARSFIAARSSSVNPLDALPVVLLADCCVPVFAGFLSAIAKLLGIGANIGAEHRVRTGDLRLGNSEGPHSQTFPALHSQPKSSISLGTVPRPDSRIFHA